MVGAVWAPSPGEYTAVLKETGREVIFCCEAREDGMQQWLPSRKASDDEGVRRLLPQVGVRRWLPRALPTSRCILLLAYARPRGDLHWPVPFGVYSDGADTIYMTMGLSAAPA